MRKQDVLLVDGSEIRRENQLRLIVYPIIYRILYIPGGELAGFLPSTVSPSISSYGTLKFLKMMSRCVSTHEKHLTIFQLSTKQRDAIGDSMKNSLDLQGP